MLLFGYGCLHILPLPMLSTPFVTPNVNNIKGNKTTIRQGKTLTERKGNFILCACRFVQLVCCLQMQVFVSLEATRASTAIASERHFSAFVRPHLPQGLFIFLFPFVSQEKPPDNIHARPSEFLLERTNKAVRVQSMGLAHGTGHA